MLLVIGVTCNGVKAEQSTYTYDPSGDLKNVTGVGNAAPMIASPPQPQLLSSSAPVSLSVSATGAGLSFQWLSNGVPIPGATGDSLVLSNLPLDNSTNFSVVISNIYGAVTSPPVPIWLDSRGVGMPDWWQLQYFGNLNQPPGDDYDGDGVDNLDEYLEGTDPTNPDSFDPRLHVAAGVGMVVVAPDQPYYTMGQTVTLTAILTSNAYFLSWSGSVVSATNQLSLLMNGHKYVTANWINPNSEIAASPLTNHFNSVSDVGSWVYWFSIYPDYLGYPDNYPMTFDPAMDAQSNSASGSLSVFSPFGHAPSPGSTDQNVFFGTFGTTQAYSKSVLIPAAAISGLSFDIHVEPGTPLSPTGDFGTITAALIDPTWNTENLSAFSGFTIPAQASNGWVHLVNTNTQEFAGFSQFFTQAAGVMFDYNNYNGYPTNDVQMWIDNVAVLTYAPIILSQPIPQVTQLGGAVSFVVVAQGACVQQSPLTYMWTLNGAPLTDGPYVQRSASNILNLANVPSSYAGIYQVTVSNAFGSVQSAPVALTVVPSLTNHFNSASDVASWLYWYSIYHDYLGTSYGIPMTNDPSMDAQSNTSSGSLLFFSPFGEAPSYPSSDQNVIFGTFSGIPWDASVQIPVNDIYGLSFDLHVNPGTPLNSSGNFGPIEISLIDPAWTAGSLSNFVYLTIPASATNGWVHLVNTDPVEFANFATNISATAAGVMFDYNSYNAADYPTNNMEMWIDNVAVLPKQLSPEIVVEPMPQVVAIGSTADMSVSAVGTQPLYYQWQLNSSNVTAGTGASLAIASASALNAGIYQVVITNVYGAATSAPASLSVLGSPVVFATNGTGIQVSNGEVLLTVSGLTGQGAVVLESSTNLIDWTRVLTNPSGFGSIPFSVAVPTNSSSQFFRTLLLPGK